MFTGIIEKCCVIDRVERGEESAVFYIDIAELAEGVAIGDSIAMNGCCLTVTSLEGTVASFDVMNETLKVTSLSAWGQGAKANAERAMASDGRFGGHVVSGHVDGTAEIVNIVEHEGSTTFTFQASPTLMEDMILRGSVCVDGVSLTICDLTPTSQTFSVSIIPHTKEVTLFAVYNIGDCVNIETDMVSKYIKSHVERILNARKTS